MKGDPGQFAGAYPDAHYGRRPIHVYVSTPTTLISIRIHMRPDTVVR